MFHLAALKNDIPDVPHPQPCLSEGIVDVRVLDHFVIGDEDAISFADRGLFIRVRATAPALRIG